MIVTLRKFTNGNISVSQGTMTIDHAGQKMISEKTVEIMPSIITEYFKNPNKYLINFEKGEIHAKPK